MRGKFNVPLQLIAQETGLSQKEIMAASINLVEAGLLTDFRIIAGVAYGIVEMSPEVVLGMEPEEKT